MLHCEMLRVAIGKSVMQTEKADVRRKRVDAEERRRMLDETFDDEKSDEDTECFDAIVDLSQFSLRRRNGSTGQCGPSRNSRRCGSREG